MKNMLKFLLAAIIVPSMLAQGPQIPLTGNIGVGGNFPLVNSPQVEFITDANHTMVYPEVSGAGGFIKVTSSLPLTATRNLIAPLSKGFQFTVDNATTGGQSIQVIGASGSGVTVPNGSTMLVATDGTDYMSTGSGGGAVASVFGRMGTITAQTGDYSFSNISGTASPSQLPVATTGSLGAVRPDGTTVTISSGIISAIGGGSGCIVSGTGLVYSTSGVCSVADFQDISTSPVNTSTRNLYLNGTISPLTGPNNVAIGYLAGNHLDMGPASVGGQANVIMGSMAAQNATSMRESVIIGSNAASSITGNGTGPDDMIFVVIGSNAADGLTNLGGAGVIIGQKALESATSSSGDVIVGTHNATQVSTSLNGTYLGASILNDCSVPTGPVVDVVDSTLVGTNVANNCIAASTITEATGVGKGSLDNIATSTGATALGVNAGSRNSTGSFNNFFGDLAGGDITSPSRITGDYNTLIAAETGSALTAGSHNVLIDTPSGVAAGSRNFLWSQNTGGALSSGNDNIFMGFAAHQNGGDTSGDVAIGRAAGLSSTYDNQVSIGANACKSALGTRDLCIGFNTGQNMTGAADVTLVGDQAGSSLNGSETNDNAFGSGADIGGGISNAVQIGTGFNGTSDTSQIYGHKFMGNINGDLFSEGNTVCESTGKNCPTILVGPPGSPIIARGGSSSTIDFVVQNNPGSTNIIIANDDGSVEIPGTLIASGKNVCLQDGTDCPGGGGGSDIYGTITSCNVPATTSTATCSGTISITTQPDTLYVVEMTAGDANGVGIASTPYALGINGKTTTSFGYTILSLAPGSATASTTNIDYHVHHN